MDQWLWIGAGLLGGLIIGGVVTAIIMGRGRGDEVSTRSLQKEFDDYQREVTAHFVETAALVNNLTNSYKAVYQHLEGGAYQLVGEETLHRQLEGVSAEPIMLEYIGQRKKAPEDTEAEVARPVSEPVSELPLDDAPLPNDTSPAEMDNAVGNHPDDASVDRGEEGGDVHATT